MARNCLRIDHNYLAIHDFASLAQLEEQVICNHQVLGSTPGAGSILPLPIILPSLLRLNIQFRHFRVLCGWTPYHVVVRTVEIA